jgi:hypothetical protein
LIIVNQQEIKLTIAQIGIYNTLNVGEIGLETGTVIY